MTKWVSYPKSPVRCERIVEASPWWGAFSQMWCDLGKEYRYDYDPRLHCAP